MRLVCDREFVLVLALNINQNGKYNQYSYWSKTFLSVFRIDRNVNFNIIDCKKLNILHIVHIFYKNTLNVFWIIFIYFVEMLTKSLFNKSINNDDNFWNCSLCIINFTIISDRIFVIILKNILIKCYRYNILVSSTCIKLEWNDTFTLRWYSVYLAVWKHTKMDSTNEENWK